MPSHSYNKIINEIHSLAQMSQSASFIEPDLYKEYDVKRGLRDLNGRGVLVGITNISEVSAFKEENGERIPIEGELYYRGYNVRDIIKKSDTHKHFTFEECAFLLLFGKLPNHEEFQTFLKILSRFRSLPRNFLRDVIMKKPSKDMMNSLARSVLTLYSYDDNPDDTSPDNVLRQCMELISMFPLLSVYGYNAYRYIHKNDSLVIHRPRPEYSTAENILHCLRPDSTFTPLEAELLDICLVLHMEHGGGNNSTFTTHLLSSSGTDTYSVIAAALGSLKGPKHGGANLKVIDMMRDMKREVNNWRDEEEVSNYLERILDHQAFDGAGLIYGIGHAIYALSDPRAESLRAFVGELAKEKGYQKEFDLYCLVEQLAPDLIAKKRKIYKGVSPNVDFFSGFVYQMLGLPKQLYTPIFAIARIAGWSAHRMEEVCHRDKIMRPAYMTTMEHKEFISYDQRG